KMIYAGIIFLLYITIIPLIVFVLVQRINIPDLNAANSAIKPVYQMRIVAFPYLWFFRHSRLPVTGCADA
ncbi:hypothetical protein ACFL0M_07610, partial [Thermodesulfobacteriota bacterium]